jgi:sulfur transfer protein SufE
LIATQKQELKQKKNRYEKLVKGGKTLNNYKSIKSKF